MKVGYAVPVLPELASYRLRVAIPSKHLGCDYVIGATGKPTFFFKNGNRVLADTLTGGVVYDVVNDHFAGKYGAEYHGMCSIADVITVASVAMAEIVYQHTGRDAVVVDDPYENEESAAKCSGNTVLWFGHSANLMSLLPHLDTIDETDCEFVLCSNTPKANVQWSRAAEDACLSRADVVLMTGTNPGASANRVVKALRAGRFVVAPENCADAWRELAEFIYVGDVRDGINWAFNNREEACQKIVAGQQFVAQRFAPKEIGTRWTEIFASVQ